MVGAAGSVTDSWAATSALAISNHHQGTSEYHAFLVVLSGARGILQAFVFGGNAWGAFFLP